MNDRESGIRQLIQKIDAIEGNSNNNVTHIYSIQNLNAIEAKLSEKEFPSALSEKYKRFNNSHNTIVSAITSYKAALSLSSTNKNSNSQENPADLNDGMQNLILNNVPFKI